jgi:hypothetical protein
MSRLTNAIDRQYRYDMKRLASALDSVFNESPRCCNHERGKTGFVLMVFPFGSANRCNYISRHAERDDLVACFREMIARLEAEVLE